MPVKLLEQSRARFTSCHGPTQNSTLARCPNLSSLIILATCCKNLQPLALSGRGQRAAPYRGGEPGSPPTSFRQGACAAGRIQLCRIAVGKEHNKRRTLFRARRLHKQNAPTVRMGLTTKSGSGLCAASKSVTKSEEDGSETGRSGQQHVRQSRATLRGRHYHRLWRCPCRSRGDRKSRCACE